MKKLIIAVLIFAASAAWADTCSQNDVRLLEKQGVYRVELCVLVVAEPLSRQYFSRWIAVKIDGKDTTRDYIKAETAYNNLKWKQVKP